MLFLFTGVGCALCRFRVRGRGRDRGRRGDRVRVGSSGVFGGLTERIGTSLLAHGLVFTAE